MIIDAHTHRYADEVIADPVKFALRQKESHWLKLVAPTQGKGVQGWSDRKEMLSQMKTDGVDRAILHGWYWENPLSCVWQNDWHAKWIRQILKILLDL